MEPGSSQGIQCQEAMGRKAWERLLREAVEPPSLQILRTQVDTVPGHPAVG